MNIEDKSDSVVWTNSTSTEIESTAIEAYPWYLGQSGWAANHLLGKLVDARNLSIEQDTPVALSATQTTSSGAGSLNWPMWRFYVVAGTLTFGSIILPLTAGKIYRRIARFSIQHRLYFRILVTLLWML
jgi:hypothetical protein